VEIALRVLIRNKNAGKRLIATLAYTKFKLEQ